MDACDLVMATMLFGLTLYAVLGGADFGAGVWEFSTALTATPKERALIERAIGPVWEANHVWLIFVLVGLFGAFPPAFAGMCRALCVPLLCALAGIVFRGAAFAFRAHLPSAGAGGIEGAPPPQATSLLRRRALWEAVFALGSTAAPFFLGASAFALAAGLPGLDAAGEYSGDYLVGWLHPLSIYGGLFAVALCANLAATYLTREAEQAGDAELTALWRRRALAGGLWMGVLAVAGLGMVATGAPELWRGVRERGWPAVAASAAAGLTALWGTAARRYLVAVVGAATAAATVLWGWALAQYPALLPPAITVASARAPEPVLRAMAWSIGAGALLLAPSLAWLFLLFKWRRPTPDR
ncbi:MAG: cytochrome d ubiquinol oxidase subunit II [Planctomycetes bacterium]|nr:cytochrome d ubiquinol oxidase subunit II [Planctomycetota bacterium]